MGMSRRERARWPEHSRKVQKSPQWKALRLAALRRDGWCCVRCGERRGLEVDHILRVGTHPAGAFDLDNLQCLCGRCHAAKTRTEVGHAVLSDRKSVV